MNQTDPRHDTPSIALIKARWHADIVDRCEQGFLAELVRRGLDTGRVEVFEAPGAFDIPLLAQRLALSGRFAAIVATGFVVDGGIYRHEFVAAAVIEALMRVQLDTDVPVVSAVLTPQHFQKTERTRRFFLDHFVVKGREAAEACLTIVETFDRLAGAPADRDIAPAMAAD
jgi:6,7-dimethyl-8-ribityllumazine synthase